MSGARAPATAQTLVTGRLRTHRALNAWMMSKLFSWYRGDQRFSALSPKIVLPPAEQWGRRIDNDHA
eukprot:6602429-Lingulodinium_polyedra.AAC.1